MKMVDLDKLIQDFSLLEQVYQLQHHKTCLFRREKDLKLITAVRFCGCQVAESLMFRFPEAGTFVCVYKKITELRGKNNILEIKLDEANRLLKLLQSKEKLLSEEKRGLLESIKCLQNNLEQQCNLRGENGKLKNVIIEMEKQNERQMERLQCEMKVLQEQHQREMEDVSADTKRKLEFKDAEMNIVLDRERSVIEELRQQMKDQQKGKQSEILKLQMEFSAKLARVQSMLEKSQLQTPASMIISPNVYKRKLHFELEEKNKEIDALRQKVKELEQQNLCTFSESRLKRKKI